MIHLLDSSLETMLRRELKERFTDPVDISFAPPDGEFPSSSVTVPAVDLFLYDVRENNGLRSQDWLVKRGSDGFAVQERPPIRVDCSYLITAWPSPKVRKPAEDEHKILSVVMAVLLSYTELPDHILAEPLRGQDPPPTATALQPGHLQSLAEFWQAMGGKPKLALNYTVTIGLRALPDIRTRTVLETEIHLQEINGERS
jgi:Pvc16 N-terminal domain